MDGEMEEPNLREEPHPSVWDLICVGTGLTEALLAGCVVLFYYFFFFGSPIEPRLGTLQHFL